MNIYIVTRKDYHYKGEDYESDAFLLTDVTSCAMDDHGGGISHCMGLTHAPANALGSRANSRSLPVFYPFLAGLASLDGTCNT